MPEPLVHVLVINWNGLRHLDECFTALAASTYSNARHILLDNGSDDGSAEHVRAHYGDDARVEIFRLEQNRGWSGANNAGIDRAIDAGAEYVFLLNNDTAIDPECIARLVAHAESDEAIGALAPKLLLFDTPELINSIGLEGALTGAAWDRGLGRLDAAHWDEVVPVVGVCGAGFFIRVEALRRTGLLPEEFEIYLDDYDLCLRIWDAGYRIETCPGARLRHKFSATMGTWRNAARKYYLNTRNRFRVIERNFPRRHLGEVARALIAGETRAVGRAVLDGSVARVWAHKKAWLAAIGYLAYAAPFRQTRPPRAGRYWHLLRTDVAFFPGVELPEHGWYRSRTIDGRRVRPMSKCAHYLHEAGKLRVTSVQPFPDLGALDVEVVANGETIARIEADGVDERVLDIPRNELVFRANKVFYAEQTGEAIDVGAWIGLEPC